MELSEEDKKALYNCISETLLDLIDNIDILTYPNYEFDNYIKDTIYESFIDAIDIDVLNEFYDKNIEEIYLKNNLIKRSYKYNFEDDNIDNENKIIYLKNIPQPEQRTSEWYTFRKNHITGSNCWKVFGSEKTRNQLFYEKLKPDTEENTNNINLNDNSPLIWGQKYEDLSILFYEYYNDVKVEEFGCIPHKTIPFLAASPDGIVTSKKMNGRMVEIKNVVSREITKIPKMEYYIQMQIQMEVCDLDQCDFVETKFVEYNSENDFIKDKYKIEKGMIIVLIENNSKFIFEYSNLFHNKEQELNDFTEQIYKKYNFTNNKLEHNNIKWFKNIYWKLDVYSNVYVPRNKKWFSKAFSIMKDFWNIIEKEKNIKDSHIKYKPIKRNNQESNNLLNNIEKISNNLIDLNNI